MDMFDGFVFLEEKKKSLIPILCQYDFLSALTAAFSITSWRKNRGAQEKLLGVELRNGRGIQNGAAKPYLHLMIWKSFSVTISYS